MSLFLKKALAAALMTLFVGVLSLTAAPKEEKKVVYYTNPADLKVKELKAGEGLIPVYFDYAILKKNKGRVMEYYNVVLAKDKKSAVLVPKMIGVKGAAKAKNMLFYADPMTPKDFTDQKKKDHMGMDFVPVYAD